MTAWSLVLWFTLGPVAGAPAAPGPPVIEVPRWSVRWLEKPAFSWLDSYQLGRAVFYQGGACPNLAQCAGGASGMLDADGKVVVKPVHERVGSPGERGFQMMANKLWGFTTWDGKVLIPARYTHLNLLDNGFSSGELAGVSGYVVINPNGREIVRGAADTQATSEAAIWVLRRDRWGAYDRDGKSLVPHRYEGVAWYSDKATGVRAGKREALVDGQGRQLTPLKYSAFDYASGGLMIFNQGGRFGVIREDGKVLLPALYDCVELYDFGENDVEIRAIDHPAGTPSDPDDRCRGGRWRHFRRDGTPVFEDSYAYLEPLLDGHHARAVKQGECDSTGNCTRGRWGVLDRTGKVVAPYVWDWVAAPGQKATAVVRNRKWGLLDASFREVVAPVHDMIHVDQDAVRFLSKDRWGVMDFSGKVLLGPKYEAILPFAGGSARFLEGGKWGLLGADGKVRLPATHLGIGLLRSGTLVFATAGKCTVRWGKDAADPIVTIVGVVLRMTGARGHDLECGQGTLGLMDAAGKVLLPAKYQMILVQPALPVPGQPALPVSGQPALPVAGQPAAPVAVPPGRAWVRLNLGGRSPSGNNCAGGKWGLADLTGRLVVPVEHEYLDTQAEHLLRVAKGGSCEVTYGRPRACTPETKWGLMRLEPVK